MNQEKLKEILKHHLKWLWVKKDGKRADLRGTDLYDANLRGADLREADLRHANLSDANMYGVNLSDANMYGVNLSDANMYGVNLYRSKGIQVVGINPDTGRIAYAVQHDDGPMFKCACFWGDRDAFNAECDRQGFAALRRMADAIQDDSFRS